MSDAFYAEEEFKPEQPQPLTRDLPPADKFPLAALGGVLGPAAEGIHDKVQAPIATCGQTVLACATLATQSHADVELPTKQVKPISSFYITVAASGERKSACDTEGLQPIFTREEALRKTCDREREEFEYAFDAWKQQKAQILSAKKKYPDRAAKQAALEELGPAPEGPLLPIITWHERAGE